MPGVPLFFMQSQRRPDRCPPLPGQGRDPVRSGRRHRRHGAHRARLAGHDKVIGFDMGGTSHRRVSHFAGEFEREFETQVAGVRMRAPMMSIHTVAAGGGSILDFDGARLRVGPRERRRQPRPGQLPARRPAGRDRRQRDAGQDPAGVLSRACSARAATSRWTARRRATVRRAGRARRAAPAATLTPEALAEGFLQIAVQQHGQRHQEDLGGARLRRHALHAAVLRRRRRPACLPGGRCAGHDAASSCTRWPACCRPTAWAWPTRTRSAKQAIELPLDAGRRWPLVAAAAGRTGRGGARPSWQRQQAAAGAVALHRRVHVRYEGSDSALVVAVSATWPAIVRRASRPRTASASPS